MDNKNDRRLYFEAQHSAKIRHRGTRLILHERHYIPYEWQYTKRRSHKIVDYLRRNHTDLNHSNWHTLLSNKHLLADKQIYYSEVSYKSGYRRKHNRDGMRKIKNVRKRRERKLSIYA